MKKITFLFLLLIASFLQTKGQVFPEDFEGIFPPTNWTIEDNGVGIAIDWISSAESFSGSKAAYIAFDNSGGDTEDWLITPQFTPSTSANVLTFYQKQEFVAQWGSSYEIRVSELSNNIVDFVTTVEMQVESGFDTTYSLHSVDLSAFNGTQIYLAFVLVQNNGDGWFIDAVSLEDPSTLVPICAINPMPTNTETAVSVIGGEVTLNWSAPATGDAPSSYEVFVGTISNSLSLVTETVNTSYTMSEVLYATDYFWKVIPKNFKGSAVSCTEWSFTTQTAPPVPANDACVDALSIFSTPYSNSQDASGATNNSGAITTCSPGMNDGVWYTFTPANGGTANIDITEVSSLFDPEVAIYSGNCGVFTCIGSEDSNIEGVDENLSVSIDAATQYWINVGHYHSSTDEPEGSFKISLSLTNGATLKVDKIDLSVNINLYPNPTNGILNIIHQEVIDEVVIYNMLGQEVLREYPNKMNPQINTSNLSIGMYVIDVFIKEKKGTYRIIKQ